MSLGRLMDSVNKRNQEEAMAEYLAPLTRKAHERDAEQKEDNDDT